LPEVSLATAEMWPKMPGLLCGKQFL